VKRAVALPLGLDLGTSSLSIVAAELATDGAFAVRAASTHDVPFEENVPVDRTIAETLRSAVGRLDGKERRCVLAAPAGDVTMRIFNVPPGMRRAEAERAAALEADTVSPLAASERLIALDPLPGRTDQMLLTVARNSSVERLVGIARAAGLQPVAVDAPFCAWRRALSRADAVLDASGDRATLTIFGDPIGTSHAYPPRLIEDRLVPQVRAALADARRSGLADVRRLAVLGPHDRFEGMVEHLTPDGYTVEPVVLGGTHAPSWALAYGLASWVLAGRGVVAA